MTKEQRTKHLQSGGITCPYCGGQELGRSAVSVDAGAATRESICDDCGQGWVDIYTLTHVESN